MSVDPVEAQDRANQPADGAEKCESNVCFPFGTCIDTMERDARPVENIAVRPRSVCSLLRGEEGEGARVSRVSGRGQSSPASSVKPMTSVS